MQKQEKSKTNFKQMFTFVFWCAIIKMFLTLEIKLVRRHFVSKKSEQRVEDLLNFIKNYIDANGYPPSVREMGKALKVNSTATIQYYLEKLETRKLIRKSSSKNRSIEVLDGFGENKAKGVVVPLVGKVAAGTPILATENIEDKYILPENLFSKNDEMFVLKVTGDSMVNAGILDGDKIVVSKQSNAKNGDIVVALLEDSATVKRFFREKNQVRLQPENDFLSPIYAKNVDILGVVVGLIRKF